MMKKTPVLVLILCRESLKLASLSGLAWDKSTGHLLVLNRYGRLRHSFGTI